jgi:multidrug efflux pump subunit AcrA (membrane-fusion protein)
MNMPSVPAFTRPVAAPVLTFFKNRTKKQLILSVIALVLGWYGYSYFFGADSTETRYILGVVEKRTIVASVSASGQISSSNLLDVKAKAGGEILSLRVEAGDTVRAGQVIAVLDSTDAQKAVRDALANLESARISLAKIQKPASALTLTQAENSLTNAEDSLAKTYTDSRTHVTNVFLDLPSTITGMETILLGTDLFSSQWNISTEKL